MLLWWQLIGAKDGITSRKGASHKAIAKGSRIEASIPVKISSCSYLETKFPLTKNIQRK
jgi:hypothetical protein